ncbi:hypothetical protein [Burkholderia latens]|uniref:hypothetical protein n=1 Tax=Burkholderia latens TaxID=488446 RepID=UPI00158E9119|nr:hypothetical protein [Burkholderia latens]
MTGANVAATILPLETLVCPMNRAAPLNGTSMNPLPAFAPLLASVFVGRALCMPRGVVARAMDASAMSFRVAIDTRQCRYTQTARNRSNALRVPQCERRSAVAAAA